MSLNNLAEDKNMIVRNLYPACVCLLMAGAIGTVGYFSGPMVERGEPPVIVLTPVKPLPAARTVNWFIEHPTERKAREAECKNDVGNAQLDADCENAFEAGSKAGFGSLADQLLKG